MIHIPLLDNPPDDVWIAKAKALTEKLEQEADIKKRNELIDDNRQLWKDIKPHLQRLSHNKCWYSEAREVFSYYHVDHFRPKKKAIDLNKEDQGGYWWLAFNWKNYRICGAVGNTIKGDHFYVKKNKACCQEDDLNDEVICFLDPVKKNDVLKVTFNDNGEIIPTERDETAWDHQRAKYTIEHLKLNYDLLTEARRNLWNDIRNRINEIQNLMKEYNQSPSASKETTIEEKMNQLREYKECHSEFSATARACLMNSGVTWAMSLVAS